MLTECVCVNVSSVYVCVSDGSAVVWIMAMCVSVCGVEVVCVCRSCWSSLGYDFRCICWLWRVKELIEVGYGGDISSSSRSGRGEGLGKTEDSVLFLGGALVSRLRVE